MNAILSLARARRQRTGVAEGANSEARKAPRRQATALEQLRAERARTGALEDCQETHYGVVCRDPRTGEFVTGMRWAGARRARTGQVLCDADPEEFQKRCTIGLFPGEWNTWTLYRTLRDNPSKEELEQMTRNVLGWWFKSSASIPGVTMGHADNLEIRIGEANQTEGLDTFGARDRLVTRSKDCPAPLFLAPGDFIPIAVRFVYRGELRTMPWPARRVVWPGIATWCPLDADWILDAIWAPVPGEAVPAPKPGLPFLPDVPAPDIDMSGIGKRISEGVKAVATPLLAGIGAVLAIVLIRSTR